MTEYIFTEENKAELYANMVRKLTEVQDTLHHAVVFNKETPNDFYSPLTTTGSLLHGIGDDLGNVHNRLFATLYPGVSFKEGAEIVKKNATADSAKVPEPLVASFSLGGSFLTVISGPSGSGKTKLARNFAGKIIETEGKREIAWGIGRYALESARTFTVVIEGDLGEFLSDLYFGAMDKPYGIPEHIRSWLADAPINDPDQWKL